MYMHKKTSVECLKQHNLYNTKLKKMQMTGNSCIANTIEESSKKLIIYFSTCIHIVYSFCYNFSNIFVWINIILKSIFILIGEAISITLLQDTRGLG